ncbi:Ferulic acid decarboxylase 1, partial [Fusarium oxysporum f. sp. albedinis]
MGVPNYLLEYKITYSTSELATQVSWPQIPHLTSTLSDQLNLNHHKCHSLQKKL